MSFYWVMSEASVQPALNSMEIRAEQCFTTVNQQTVCNQFAISTYQGMNEIITLLDGYRR